MSDLAIRLRGLTKRYGARPALQGIDLEVPAGSFFALLGPNGAGKTTLMRCLTGMLRPDSGTGQVLGASLGIGYPDVSLKSRIGYVSQQQALYERMTAGQLIDLCRSLHPRWDGSTVKRYLDMFGFSPEIPVRQMSTGMRSQLSLTLVMGANPELLILDEPTLGLDPVHRRQYLQVLLSDSLESGRTVLLSSHDLDQVERLADRIAILREGRVRLTGTVDDLKDMEKRVRVAGQPDAEALRMVPGVRKVSRDGAGWLLFTQGDPAEVKARVGMIPGVTAVQVMDQSLEEIFISYMV